MLYAKIIIKNEEFFFQDISGSVYAYDGDISLKEAKDLKWALKNNRIASINTDGPQYVFGTAAANKLTQSDTLNKYSKFIPMKKTKATTAKQTVQEPETADMRLIHTDAMRAKPERLKIQDLKWKYLVRSVLRGKNIMMTGAAGTGKTQTVQTLSNVFPDKQLFSFNLGSTQDPRSALIGNTHFKKDSGTYFSESPFVKAIQTEGAIILLDELSRAHPEAFNILMPVLDYGQRYLRLDEADGAPTIKVAEGVSFIATANIGAEYTATRVLDRALMDRFVIIEMDMLEKADEKALLQLIHPTLAENKINAIAEIACATRKEIKTTAPKISTIISTRMTIELAGLMEDGFTLEEAAEVAIYPFYDEAGGADSERTFVAQLVQKHKVVEKTDIFNTDTEEDTAEVDLGDIENIKPF